MRAHMTTQITHTHMCFFPYWMCFLFPFWNFPREHNKKKVNKQKQFKVHQYHNNNRHTHAWFEKKKSSHTCTVRRNKQRRSSIHTKRHISSFERNWTFAYRYLGRPFNFDFGFRIRMCVFYRNIPYRLKVKQLLSFWTSLYICADVYARFIFIWITVLRSPENHTSSPNEYLTYSLLFSLFDKYSKGVQKIIKEIKENKERGSVKLFKSTSSRPFFSTYIPLE